VLAQMALIPAPVTAEVPLEPMYLREPHITQAKAVPFSTL
jgi:hypothetical protein